MASHSAVMDTRMLPPPSEPMSFKKPSIAERLGGQKALTLAVDTFYQRLLDDPALSVFFSKTDMKVQRAKQVKFLTFALGGGAEAWKGKSMYEAHKGLGITDAHFDAVAGHLIATLEGLGVPADLMGEAITVVASTREQVCGRQQ